MEEASNIPRLEIEGLEIFSEGFPTEVDGKIRCYWTDLEISMCDCPVCGADSATMAKLWDEIFDNNEPHRLMFGISPLHCEGRIFGWLLKGTTYRDFESWQCRGDDNKDLRCLREMELEEDFKEKFGFVVDWTSLSGGLVRAIFANPQKLAEVLIIYPVEWLEELRILFETMNCRYSLCPQKVGAKLWNWIKRFHDSEVGKWHRPNVYVHLFFHHFAPMLEYFPVAPGLLLSEQGSEAKNKVFRNDRENHARQCGPVENLTDIGLRSHHRGDPQIQALMMKPKIHQRLDPEVIALLANPDEVLVPPPALPTILAEDEDDTDDAMDAEGDAKGDIPEAALEAAEHMELDN